ncbi:GDT1-like protein 4 [Nymphaea thermarum]|nr:GDT1-like protein 4 [Nymphaea thermarum]
MAVSRNPRNRRSFSFALPLLLLLLFETAIFSCVSAEGSILRTIRPMSPSRCSIAGQRNVSNTFFAQIIMRTSRNVDTDVDDVDSKTKLTDITGYSEFGLGLFDAFFASLSMIIVSEIGDETFIIAALMAMRHPKSIVLSGALTALFVMTVLSTALGRIVPNLISRKHTNNAATVLYAFFGLRLLYIAWRSSSKTSQKKEMEEVEEKLEAGQGKTAFRRFFSRFCTPIFLESFILTFLAEWGDRSQIATIALATHKNALGVAVGATLGHTICTSLAVVGGSILASKISQGTVATIGGLLFLCFSLSSYFYPPL